MTKLIAESYQEFLNEGVGSFNRDEYKEVKQDRKRFDALPSVSHNNMVKFLFGGELTTGDIIEHPDGDILKIADVMAEYGYPLNKNGTFSQKSQKIFGLTQYHKLEKS